MDFDFMLRIRLLVILLSVALMFRGAIVYFGTFRGYLDFALLVYSLHTLNEFIKNPFNIE